MALYRADFTPGALSFCAFVYLYLSLLHSRVVVEWVCLLRAGEDGPSIISSSLLDYTRGLCLERRQEVSRYVMESL